MNINEVIEAIRAVGQQAFLYAILVWLVIELAKRLGLVDGTSSDWGRLSNLTLSYFLTGPEVTDEQSIVLFALVAMISSAIYRLWDKVLWPAIQKAQAKRKDSLTPPMVQAGKP